MADKILIVDDDEDFRKEFQEMLEGYNVIEASNGHEALKLLKRANEISLIILDVMMPGLNGIEVLKEMKKMDPDLGIIISTGYSSKDVAIEALKSRADDYIEKPFDIEKVKKIIDKVLESKKGKDVMDSNGIKGKIEKVKRFTERNCFKKISLKEAADVAFLSQKYLSRVFKQITGMNFSGYKLKVKIEKSKELLKKTDYNINQISDKLGYENTESFIRQFKKLVGRTPTEYRKNKIKKNNRSRKSKQIQQGRKKKRFSR